MIIPPCCLVHHFCGRGKAKSLNSACYHPSYPYRSLWRRKIREAPLSALNHSLELLFNSGLSSSSPASGEKLHTRTMYGWISTYIWTYMATSVNSSMFLISLILCIKAAAGGMHGWRILAMLLTLLSVHFLLKVDEGICSSIYTLEMIVAIQWLNQTFWLTSIVF